MRKRKQGPALFELLHKESKEPMESLRVPKWWAKKESEIKKAASESYQPADEPACELEMPKPKLATDEATADRWLALDGDRIRFSLTSVGAAVSVFVLMALLLGSFEVGNRLGEQRGVVLGYQQGRTSYSSEVLDEIDVARSQPPATHLVRNLLTEPPTSLAARRTPVGASRTPSGQHQWIPGHTYIVAQEFSATRADDAMLAKTFLAQRGIQTVVVSMRNGAVQLITAQGYNHRDSTQKRMGERLLQKLHHLGNEYYKGGGQYKLEGYFKALKNENW